MDTCLANVKIFFTCLWSLASTSCIPKSCSASKNCKLLHGNQHTLSANAASYNYLTVYSVLSYVPSWHMPFLLTLSTPCWFLTVVLLFILCHCRIIWIFHLKLPRLMAWHFSSKQVILCYHAVFKPQELSMAEWRTAFKMITFTVGTLMNTVGIQLIIKAMIHRKALYFTPFILLASFSRNLSAIGILVKELMNQW